jgi:hypothetical protein
MKWDADPRLQFFKQGHIGQWRWTIVALMDGRGTVAGPQQLKLHITSGKWEMGAFLREHRPGLDDTSHEARARINKRA